MLFREIDIRCSYAERAVELLERIFLSDGFVQSLADSPSRNQTDVYDELKEQLVPSSERWYETGLPW